MAGNKVLEYLITAKDATSSAISSAVSRIKGFSSGVFTNLMNIKAGWDMLAGTTRAAVNVMVSAARHLWSAIEEAMKFETAEKQFAILMGSMDKAKAHMKDLADFAAQTPFEFNEIAKASRLLITFSGGALGAKDSLTILGDAAAATGNRFDEVGFWVGRLYASLKGGQPFGESAMRLTEMAILTPEVRTKMEALTSTAGHSAEAWAVLEQHLKTYSGGMAELSQTGDGLVSTVKDNWTAVVRDFGQTFLSLAKTELAYLITTLDKLRADGTIKKWAEESLAVVKPLAEGVMNLFDGQTRKLTIDAAWDSLLATFTAGADILKAAIEIGIDNFIKRIPSIGEALGRGIKGIGKAGMDAGRWLGKTAGYVGADIGGMIGSGIGVDPRIVDQSVSEVKSGFSTAYGYDSQQNSETFSDRIKPIVENLSKTLKENADKVSAAADDRKARAKAGGGETETVASLDAQIKALIATKREDEQKKNAESELKKADEKRINDEAAKNKAESDKKIATEQAQAQIDADKTSSENRLKNAEAILAENSPIAKAKFTMGDVDARISGNKQAKEEARLQKKYEDRLADVQRRVDAGADPSKLNKKDKAILDMDKERKAAQAKIDQAEQDRKNAQMLLQASTDAQNTLLGEIKDSLKKVITVGG